MTPQQIEAMKLALEALVYLKKPIANGWDAGAQKEAQDKAITALEEALAQPEQIQPSAYSNTHQLEERNQ